MIGLVLWYKVEDRVGLIWCEDQGPLAFIGSTIGVPDNVALRTGDQVEVETSLQDRVRYVTQILNVSQIPLQTPPGELLAAFTKYNRLAKLTKRPSSRRN